MELTCAFLNFVDKIARWQNDPNYQKDAKTFAQMQF